MDLSIFTPEQLAAFSPQQLEVLAASMNGRDNYGRSPIRADRQLHDLRLLPNKDDPRPTFFWSADAPRDGRDLTKISRYHMLMWHRDTGEEITVYSAAEEAQRSSEYTTEPPVTPVVDPVGAARDALADLTPEELQMVVEAQRSARLLAVQAKLAALPAETVDRLFAEPVAAEPVKRGPGRPRKSDAA